MNFEKIDTQVDLWIEEGKESVRKHMELKYILLLYERMGVLLYSSKD